MPDPTGRWIKPREWQCPACGTVNSEDRERCADCAASVRPSFEEPMRALDTADIIGQGKKRDGGSA